jgi:putative phosphoesterase
MRIAIISDIHSNLEALEKTLELIAVNNIDKIVCLGDVVGYGASPNECLSLLQSAKSYFVLGNHDKAVADLSDIECFNAYAREAIFLTQKVLKREFIDFIKEFPLSLTIENVLFVHSSPHEPDRWHYVINETDARENFSSFSSRVCFVGHSHVPEIFCEDASVKALIPEKKFIINVGSVGQPRDGDWRLSFGIIDTSSWSYEGIRSEYEIGKAAEKIRKIGLPGFLADRILVGK